MYRFSQHAVADYFAFTVPTLTEIAMSKKANGKIVHLIVLNS